MDAPVEQARLHGFFQELIGARVTELAPLSGGRNSRVYRLGCEDGQLYAGKVYFCQAADPRDRLGAEFEALSVLREQGVQAIPRPIAANRGQNLAVYSFVDGRPFVAGEIKPGDIDQALDFLGRLRQISRQGVRLHAPASAACFSLADFRAILAARRASLAQAAIQEGRDSALADFLDHEFAPLLEQVGSWLSGYEERHGIKDNDVLGPSERTLSPSDFGFHNALRREDGQVVFVDFEYFGWDDPAKMIGDFLLHPAMNLPWELKMRFSKGMLSVFGDLPALPVRLGAVYPLLGLIWCLILLNEFVPDHRQRRSFAGLDDRAPEWRLVQLDKARDMLRKVASEYERFPYV